MIPKSSSQSALGHQLRNENTNKVCRVEGCNQPRTGMSSYCGEHRYRKLRHGHPLQQPVSPHMFEEERIEALRAIFGSTRSAKYKQHFLAKWDQMVQDAQAIIERDKKGVATITGARRTAYWIQAVEQKYGSDPRKIIGPLVGIMLKLKRCPSLVLDEDALKYQVARTLFRMIDPKNHGREYEGLPEYLPYFNETVAVGMRLLEAFLPSVYHLDRVLIDQKRASDPKNVFTDDVATAE